MVTDPSVGLEGLALKDSLEIIEVVPSAEEIVQGRLSDANCKRFLSGMHRDGCVVLTNVVDPKHLDAIHSFLEKDALTELKKKGHHTNFGVENIQQGPPLTSKYFFNDVYLNKLLFHGITLYLGHDSKWNFVSGNTALPNASKRQPPHSDAMFTHPACPFYVVANIPTVDVTPENGATEIWLGGTQRYAYDDQVPHDNEGTTMINPDVVESRKKSSPGCQPSLSKGSILVRDLRVWHAGMPNKSDEFRGMIALGFSSSWWHDAVKFKIPLNEGLVEQIYHGTKGTGIVPLFQEVSFEDYEAARNKLGFSFAEHKYVASSTKKF